MAGARGEARPSWALIGAVALGGLFFAADLAVWHIGILQTKLANATLFGNFASFLFAIYGFFLLRRLPGGVQGGALVLAVLGTILLLGRSYELSPENLTGDLFCLLAGLFYTFYLVAVDRARRTWRLSRPCSSPPPPARCRCCCSPWRSASRCCRATGAR